MSSLTDEECGICLEKLKNEIAHLSCNHFFHYNCIGDWINKSKELKRDIICPICSQEFEIINIYLPKMINHSKLENNINDKNKTNNNSNNNNNKKTCNIL